MINKSPMIRIAPVGELNAVDREAKSPFMWTVAYRMKQKGSAPALNVGQQASASAKATASRTMELSDVEMEEEVLA